MKTISDLQKDLEFVKEKYGDLPVEVLSDEEGVFKNRYFSLCIENDDDGKSLSVLLCDFETFEAFKV